MKGVSLGAGPVEIVRKSTNPNETGTGWCRVSSRVLALNSAEQSFLGKGPGLPYPILPFSTRGF
jgi:hypothetical protein